MATNVERPLEWMRFEPVKFGLLVDEMPRAQVGTVMKLILRLWEFGPMSEAAVRTVADLVRINTIAGRKKLVSLSSVEVYRDTRTR